MVAVVFSDFWVLDFSRTPRLDSTEALDGSVHSPNRPYSPQGTMFAVPGPIVFLWSSTAIWVGDSLMQNPCPEYLKQYLHTPNYILSAATHVYMHLIFIGTCMHM